MSESSVSAEVTVMPKLKMTVTGLTNQQFEHACREAIDTLAHMPVEVLGRMVKDSLRCSEAHSYPLDFAEVEEFSTT